MDKKKIAIIGGIAAVVIVGIIIAVVVANSGKGGDDSGKDGGTSQQKGGDDKDGGDDKKTKTITADDLKNVDETVSFGDYDSQFTLSKAIQNGEKLGKVVKIDGTVSHYGKGFSYTVGQKKADGSGFIGTVFTIEDGEESDYPADGDHVVLTGVVVADEETGLVFTLKTLKAFVEKK